MRNERHNVGIDLGTVGTSIAIANDAHLKKGEGAFIAYFQPTLFGVDKDGAEVYGDVAKNLMRFEGNGSVVSNIKRIIRNDPDAIDRQVSVGNKTFTYREILKRIIENAIDSACKSILASGYTNNTLGNVVLTYPCGLNEGILTASEYTTIIKEIVQEHTGLPFSSINLQFEPVCAVYNLIDRRRNMQTDKDDTVLVVDLGGGTLDLTVVQYDSTTAEFKVITSDGDLWLGGNDYTKVLIDDVLAKEACGIDTEDSMQMSELEIQVEELKKRLTYSKAAAATVEIDDDVVTFTRTQADFKVLSQDLNNRIINAIQSILQLSGRVNTIYLTGGASVMPQIREVIEDNFPDVQIEQDEHPETSVSRGAALMAMPNGVVGVSNVIPFSYGFTCIKEDTQREMIYNGLIKDTPFDEEFTATSSTRFSAHSNTQKTVTFTIYESDCRDLEPWQEIDGTERLSGIKVVVPIPVEYHGRAKDYALYVTMKITSTGEFDFIVKDGNGESVGKCNCKNVNSKVITA